MFIKAVRSKHFLFQAMYRILLAKTYTAVFDQVSSYSIAVTPTVIYRYLH